ncbi:MAG: hypothetical protein J7L66_04350 [Anaerolineaceae bacterium]|nr:hypothetical protein [Anaerolineaceae bacterium]
MTACVNGLENTIESSRTPQPIISPVGTSIATVEYSPDSNEYQNEGSEILPRVISSANVDSITLVKNLYPYFPELTTISSNGKVAALGDYSGIEIFDVESKETIMEIDVVLPECHYGMERYFQLNYDGSFIAIVTRDGIQVWRVGGGLVYEAPFFENYVLDNLSCGMDIPQLAFTPDGVLLAESGVQFINLKMERYFRVTNILKREIVYEWDGSDSTPHGQFYLYPGLGFSADGKVMQTFDLKRFKGGNDDLYTAFRFWSTRNWQELNRDSEEIMGAFLEGQLRFAISVNDSILIMDKIGGTPIESIQAVGCVMETPCPVRLSPDGNKVAFLHVREALSYKREPLWTLLEVYDLVDLKKLGEYSLIQRNLDGIYVKNTGEVVYKSKEVSSTWWTNTDYFSGFYQIDDKNIVFIPQVTDYKAADCFFNGSCQIDMEDLSIACKKSILTSDNSLITIEEKEGGHTIQIELDAKDKISVDIRNPESWPGDRWQLRFLDYIQETDTAFFCLDHNYREETCVVMDFSSNRILLQQIDLYGLRFSKEFSTAAFVDRGKKALFLFNVETKVLKEMRSYHAVAASVKPVFLHEGRELIYLVQSLKKDENIFIERIDVESEKVIKRYDTIGLEGVKISALAASNFEELWAVADVSGKVYFINPLSDEVIYILDASDDPIVDILFSRDGKYLFTMERSGIISVWGTECK